MADTIARATLGLTQPNPIEHPQISFAAKDTDVTEWKGDMLAIGVTEKDMIKDDDSKFSNPILEKLDARLGGLLSEATSEENFKGKSGQSTVLRVPGLGSKRFALIGLGNSSFSPSAFRSFGEAVASAAKTAQASTVATVLASSEGLLDEIKLSAASALASGICSWCFNGHVQKWVCIWPLSKVCLHLAMF